MLNEYVVSESVICKNDFILFSKISNTAKRLKQLTKNGMHQNDAWNTVSIDLVQSVKVCCIIVFIYETIRNSVVIVLLHTIVVNFLNP